MGAGMLMRRQRLVGRAQLGVVVRCWCTALERWMPCHGWRPAFNLELAPCDFRLLHNKHIKPM